MLRIRRAKTWLLASSFCGVFLLCSDADAQTALPSASDPSPSSGVTLAPPHLTWLGLTGDSIDPASSGVGAAPLIPLRLGLTAFAPPVGQSFPGCGYSVIGSRQAFAITLIPHLTLFGFSRIGCPVDSVIGGGLVYEKPITRTVSLVMSAGAIYRPGNLGGLAGVPLPELQPVRGVDLRPDVRADILWNRGHAGSLSLGVSLLTKGVTFAGAF